MSMVQLFAAMAGRERIASIWSRVVTPAAGHAICVATKSRTTSRVYFMLLISSSEAQVIMVIDRSDDTPFHVSRAFPLFEPEPLNLLRGNGLSRLTSHRAPRRGIKIVGELQHPLA